MSTTTTAPAQVNTTVAETVAALPTWKGNVVTHTLNERAQAIAATIAPLAEQNDKGTSLSKKAYYAAGSAVGYRREVLEDIEQFNEDYALAVHAVSADLSLGRMVENKDIQELTVKAAIGNRTRYRDTFRREHTRDVNTGKPGDADRQSVSKTDYGYHAPSISTKYKSFGDSRAAVHSLARDLLGE